MRRLRGLFIITRALLPIIVVVGLLAATWLTSRSLGDATERYGASLGEQLDAVQAAVAEANEGLEAIGGFVTATVASADALLDGVAGLRDSVRLELPTIEVPDFTILDIEIELPDLRLGDGFLEIPIPGVEPLQNLAGDLAEAGRAVAEPVIKVTALAKVPPQLEAAAVDSAEYASDVRAAIQTWFLAVVFVLLAAAIVWVVAAFRPMATELRRGWSMLRGRPSTAVALSSLADRVAALERALSAG